MKNRFKPGAAQVLALKYLRGACFHSPRKGRTKSREMMHINHDAHQPGCAVEKSVVSPTTQNDVGAKQQQVPASTCAARRGCLIFRQAPAGSEQSLRTPVPTEKPA
jgi:hypothetical protein